jgi:hypothetical protein
VAYSCALPLAACREAFPLSPVRHERIGHDADRLRRRADAVDGHHVEAAGIIDAPGPGEIVERHRAYLPSLPERNRLDGLAIPRGSAGLHLDEDNRPPVLADDVNFSKPRAVPSGKNDVPAASEFATRELFSGFSEDLTIGTRRHTVEQSNTRTGIVKNMKRNEAHDDQLSFMSFTYFMTFMFFKKLSMSGQMFAPLRLWPANG